MKRTTALFAVILAFLLAVGLWLGNRWASDRAFHDGAAAGLETLKHLQLVWPDFLQMPDKDRLVLAELAMRCRLRDEPLLAENVVQCLTRAAAREDGGNHRAVLARLLPSEYAPSPAAK